MLCPPRCVCLSFVPHLVPALFPQLAFILSPAPVLFPVLSPIWSGMLCPPVLACLRSFLGLSVCLPSSPFVSHLVSVFSTWSEIPCLPSWVCLPACLLVCRPSGLRCWSFLPSWVQLVSSFVSGLVPHLVFHLVWDAVCTFLSCLRCVGRCFGSIFHFGGSTSLRLPPKIGFCNILAGLLHLSNVSNPLFPKIALCAGCVSLALRDDCKFSSALPRLWNQVAGPNPRIFAKRNPLQQSSLP